MIINYELLRITNFIHAQYKYNLDNYSSFVLRFNYITYKRYTNLSAKIQLNSVAVQKWY